MNGKTWVIVVLVIAIAWLYLDRGDAPSPRPGRVDAGAVEAGKDAVEVLRREMAAALETQAEAAENGEFSSSTDYAKFLEKPATEALKAFTSEMDRRVQETVGTGEWDSDEAASVSRGLALGLEGK